MTTSDFETNRTSSEELKREVRGSCTSLKSMCTWHKRRLVLGVPNKSLSEELETRVQS